MSRTHPVWWWTRWTFRYLPRQAFRRLTVCRRQHVGPMYDGWVCLHCGTPWFAKDDSQGEAKL